MTSALMLVAVLLAGGGDARGWTKLDTALELAAATTVLVDCAQTLDIKRHAPDVVETNPLLGRSPSDGKVLTFCAVNIAAGALVSRLLPRPWRSIWQAARIGLELEAVRQNHWLGLRVHF